MPAFGDDSAYTCKDCLHPDMYVGSAADNLETLLAGVDLAKVQSLGVGMLSDIGQLGNDEGCEIGTTSLNAIHLKSKRRQLLDNLAD